MPTQHLALVNDLVYIDSFTGLVPAKILDTSQIDDLTELPKVATVRVTAARPGWRRGEIADVPVRSIVSRRSIVVRNRQYCIVGDTRVLPITR